METVLNIRLELFGTKDLEVATILANIGNVESAEGNCDSALRGDRDHAWKMDQKLEGYLLRKAGYNDGFLAYLTYAYGNLEYDRKRYKQALGYYNES